MLIRLDQVNVALNGVRVLHNLSWELKRGENWAVFGGNGAGKSTLLRLLRGEIWPAPVNGGTRLYNFDSQSTASPIGVKQRVKIVSAEQQTRYARMHEWQLTARDIVFSGFHDSELLWHRPTRPQAKRVEQIMAILDIGDLADTDFKKLSQGQLRKVLIARALVSKPDMLVLDEVGVGLDAISRHQILDLIQRAVEAGTQVLMTTHRRDELIPAVTHVLELKGGRITDIRRQTTRQPGWRDDGRRTTSHTTSAWRTMDQASSVKPALSLSKGQSSAPFLIRIANAKVALDEGARVVLHDVNWQMNDGEHWMIVGDNGVGKSTLLKLILGELRPAHGGTIERFGTHDVHNVWEIKKRIGFVSADFQTRYHVDLPTEKVIASGFFASVGWLQPMTRNQQRRMREMIELFKLEPLAKRSILEMSYGQARKVLIARAFVTDPRVVILDEVFDGLDASFRAELTDMLERVAQRTGLILATHHEADCLPCITHRMVIDKAHIVAQEQRV